MVSGKWQNFQRKTIEPSTSKRIRPRLLRFDGYLFGSLQGDALYNAGSEGGLRWNDKRAAHPLAGNRAGAFGQDIALPTMNNFVSPFA